MSKFKVGDKVKVVRKDEEGCSWNSEGLMDKTLGEEGEVIDILQPNAVYPLRYTVEFSYGKYWRYNENCLELAQEETMSTLTHKELLQALLDGETLVSDDSLEIQLESDGTTSMTIPTGAVREKYSMSLWHIPSSATTRNRTWTIKPKVILINGIEVPEPCRVKPEDGHYYYPCFDNNDENNIAYSIWSNSAIDTKLRKAGLIHTTKEAAIQHAKALLSFTSQEEI